MSEPREADKPLFTWEDVKAIREEARRLQDLHDSDGEYDLSTFEAYERLDSIADRIEASLSVSPAEAGCNCDLHLRAGTHRPSCPRSQDLLPPEKKR
jgi:hypothetical protein